ncbi:formate-dependent phosphoribosylglycinamide formyltransferase [Opacimonas viscosa]|uniref:Formate-dependent phosphoribosylglycinamide formyltransferase n=1 Tax=Opacimonas viscosa TaxID=2961944 RepID=A0AA41WYW4_9ALTE|nr:formate-dependent phosphoribosylglycinamide formyltransferase [Opacimonas viscosa]MCP3428870.1 formate-dependent phosphoribosylglycinamide formyltransferase [Opacimonas viscosa]
MSVIGTPFTDSATKVLLCGAGELGKEVVIELKRLGCEVIACDSYDHAPAMQVADRSYTFSMLDEAKLLHVVQTEKPDYIVPEVEAIATRALLALEKEGFNVVPSANAAHLTMNREGIRLLVAEELGIETSKFVFADDFSEFTAAIDTLGLPCLVKPIMSSSGKGQSLIKTTQDIKEAWEYAQAGGRAGAGRVIVESFVDFDYEITLLTIQHANGVSFCEPIGHTQLEGDYQESWQPQQMSPKALAKSKEIAEQVTTALGGWGLFGVELFIKGDKVIFSEVSPRPHDTGMVTMISQNLSEFALHARAFLGLPIPNIDFYGPSASVALVAFGQSKQMSYGNLAETLAQPGTDLRLFGKPEVNGTRRMGVMLARGETIDEALAKGNKMKKAITKKF